MGQNCYTLRSFLSIIIAVEEMTIKLSQQTAYMRKI